MSQKRVTIVGVGALGSHVALLLRNDAHLCLIDFDRVEHKNVQAQFHSVQAVGRNKAEAERQLLQLLFGLRAEAVPHRLTEANAKQLLAGDLVIDCLDNAVSRQILQRQIRAAGGPACLHGALSAEGQFGRAIWDEHFQIDEEGEIGAPTCEGGAHLPFIALVAASLARSAQTYLSSGRKLGWSIHPGGIVQT